MSVNRNRRNVLLAGASAMAGLAFPLSRAGAQSSYPNRPITFICPWPSGGTAARTMQVLCGELEKHLGQKIQFQNIAGSSGGMGTYAIAKARPDGYTIGQFPVATVRLAQLDMVTFDPLRDFTFLARAYGQPCGVVVRANAPYQSLAELIAAAKAQPGKLSYASAGLGSTSHVGMAQLLQAAKVTMKHVPYKGGAPALRDLLSGQVDAQCDSSVWVDDVKQGRLRLLVIFGEQRMAAFPSVPTLKEAGYDIVVESPNGIVAPAGLDLQIESRLRLALKQAIRSDAFTKVCQEIQAPVLYQDGDAFRSYVLAHFEQQKQVIQHLGLRKQVSQS